MFRLIGFQCVITKPSAESAFRLSSGLPPLPIVRMRCESLLMQKARVMNLICPKKIQGFQTKMKDETRRRWNVGGQKVHQLGGGVPASLAAICFSPFPVKILDSHPAPFIGGCGLWIHTVAGSKCPEQMFWNDVQIRIEFRQLLVKG